MKRLISSHAIAGMLLLSAGPACGSTTGLSLLAPPERSFVERGTISVVASVNGHETDEIRMTVNGSRQPPHRGAGGIVCYGGVRLSSGENRITIAALKSGKVIDEKTIRVFSGDECAPGYGAALPGFKRYVFHTADMEKRCDRCHQMDYGERGSSSSPGKSPCFGCHGKMLDGLRFVHGPSAVWACNTCHRRETGGPMSGALRSDGQSCVECHAESIEEWEKRKFRHGPTEAGMCVVCHNPHGSDLPFFIRMKPGRLCNSCHEMQALQPHVISGFTRNGHPLEVDAGKARLGMAISCASCHNPHAGDSPRFLIGYEGSLSSFCMRCHKF
ncbi:MAG TPA: cytochrome c3 family protein [Geobacteraceae bacterium]